MLPGTLLCKPLHKDIVISKKIKAIDVTLSFRSLDLETDLDLIHEWVNSGHAKKFWQLQGSRSALSSIYRAILKNPFAHSFIGCIDEKPFCQVDAYSLEADELAKHIWHNDFDAGLHFLMCPPTEMVRHTSKYALKLFQEYFFSFEHPGVLYAEPDEMNNTANLLALRSGFHFRESIQLESKVANLYCITRKQFNEQNIIA